MVHRNFEQTEEMINNLLEMNSKLDVLEEMLATDSQELVGPAPNLLSIHFQINRLEAFRNQTMHQAKQASAASRQKLVRVFERLSQLIVDFETYLMELARNILPLVRAGSPDVVVKLIKIAEFEGREDEKVRLRAAFWRDYPLTWASLGNCHSPRQKGRQDGCCIEIQIHAGQRTRHQTLPLQDQQNHHGHHPIRIRRYLRTVPTGSRRVPGQPGLDIPGPHSHRERRRSLLPTQLRHVRVLHQGVSQKPERNAPTSHRIGTRGEHPPAPPRVAQGVQEKHERTQRPSRAYRSTSPQR
jgi:hypothetical protein